MMATEEQTKEMAYAIWEQEGRPEGKDVEHYFRAKQILEQQEPAHVAEPPPSSPTAELAVPTAVAELPPPTKKRRGMILRSRR